jgi:hypothetical protein
LPFFHIRTRGCDQESRPFHPSEGITSTVQPFGLRCILTLVSLRDPLHSPIGRLGAAMLVPNPIQNDGSFLTSSSLCPPIFRRWRPHYLHVTDWPVLSPWFNDHVVVRPGRPEAKPVYVYGQFIQIVIVVQAIFMVMTASCVSPMCCATRRTDGRQTSAIFHDARPSAAPLAISSDAILVLHFASPSFLVADRPRLAT